MDIIDLTKESEELYFVCLEDWSDEIKEAGSLKREWYERMKDQGLRVKLARNDEGVIGGMIQYMPAETSWIDGNDIHLHVPAGAVPKDGPSAGITMATALASLLSQRPVRSHVAMTGEITLRGQVLPIGGVKEKILAAHRFGLTTVLLPSRNENDLDDIPEEVRDDINVILVDRVDQVLAEALGEPVELIEGVQLDAQSCE